ncbi:MAG: YraN family protein [Formivibrio sp.]|nr:YraN family protein [Formivibrio sp.]
MNLRGAAAEDAAAQFLQRQGLRIVARNWSCRCGELDLIAREGDTLVFIEVRQRTSNGYGGAAASIGATKRAKLTAAAQAYLQTLPVIPPCRFDAICMDGTKTEWLKNCIDASW